MHTTVSTAVIIISDMTGVLRQLLKHVVVQIPQVPQTWRMNDKFMFLKDWGYYFVKVTLEYYQ